MPKQKPAHPMFHLLMSMEKATRILTSQIPTNIPGLVSDHIVSDHTRIKTKNHQASAARHLQIPQKQENLIIGHQNKMYGCLL